MAENLQLFNLSEDQVSKLSADELANRLKEAQSLIGDLEHQIERKRKEERKGFVQELKELISERGYEVEDIANDLAPGTGRARAGRGTSRRSRYKYLDPGNPDNTYISGPFALWMKRQMSERGMNPDSKEDRERFKQTLKRVENT
jgi:hypothetical protein